MGGLLSYKQNVIYKHALILVSCIIFLSCTEYPPDQVSINLVVEDLNERHNTSYQYESELETKNIISKDYPIHIEKVEILEKYKGILDAVQINFRVVGIVHTFAYDNGDYRTGKRIEKGKEKFNAKIVRGFKKENGNWRITNVFDYFELKK